MVSSPYSTMENTGTSDNQKHGSHCRDAINKLTMWKTIG